MEPFAGRVGHGTMPPASRRRRQKEFSQSPQQGRQDSQISLVGTGIGRGGKKG